MLSNVGRDVRYALRTFRRSPGFAVAAMAPIALGIGINTGVFSILNSVALRPLAVPDSSELVSIHQRFQGVRERRIHGSRSMFSVPEYRAYRDGTQTLSGLMAYSRPWSVTMGADTTEEVEGVLVSCNYFDVLRLRPAAGPGFTSANCGDPAAPPIVILSHDLWTRAFAADPGIAGKTITLNGRPVGVAGVAPPGFAGVDVTKAALFAPTTLRAVLRPDENFHEDARTSWLSLTGRRNSGASTDAVAAELAVIAGRIDRQEPGRTTTLTVQPATSLALPEARRDMFSMASLVLPAFGLVLLIACANVANLLLARSAARSKEVAVRTALGASRVRTVAQLLGETFVLALAGAAVGLLVAKVGIDFFNAGLATLDTPLWLVATMDPIVIAFVVGLTGLSTLAAGTIPALRATQTNIAAIMNDEARGSSSGRMGKLTRGLVIAQLAVSCGLLVAAGLMIRTVINVARFDYGFDTGDIFTARLGLFEKDYPTPPAQWQFYDALMTGLEGRPGVRAVAFTSDLPARGGQMHPVTLDGVAYPTEQDHPLARRIVITPRYFDVVEVKPVRGRTFERTDGPDAQPVAIVNERFVELLRLARIYVPWYIGLWRGNAIPDRTEFHHPKVRQLLSFVEQSGRRLACAIFWAMVRHGEQLRDDQGRQARIETIGEDLLTIATAALEASSPARVNGGEPVWDLVDHFVADAQVRIDRAISELRGHNGDDIPATIGQHTVGGKYAGLSHGIIPRGLRAYLPTAVGKQSSPR
jgi:predicted permease